MRYSNNDYRYLRYLRDEVSKAKRDYINSLELYILYQLHCASLGITEESLLKEHYLEYEKIRRLYVDMLNCRDKLQHSYCSLVAFEDYLKEEYSKESNNGYVPQN